MAKFLVGVTATTAGALAIGADLTDVYGPVPFCVEADLMTISNLTYEWTNPNTGNDPNSPLRCTVLSLPYLSVLFVRKLPEQGLPKGHSYYDLATMTLVKAE